ncbi:MAG TPA: HdeD family acid-resistance protein [Candidatus Dormibacteraeota bacterium]|nr:HdeD family acid-resistance protein [Candidatus Dormibacteraeota bacterium]
MLHSLARNWWALLLRGFAAVLFGGLAFLVPGTTIYALVILFGAYAFVDGVFAIASAVRAAEAHERWWPFVIEGVIGLAIAAITFFQPHITAFALYITIAVWAFLTGIFEIVAAVQLRKAIAGELLLIVSGVLSILFAALLVAFPQVGALTIVYIIGAYAMVFGVLMIGLAFRLRGHAGHTP